MDTFTEQNSSDSFPLRALLGELSTSMGRGELFRFMSWCRRDGPVPVVSVLALVGPTFRRPPCPRWTLALTLLPVRHPPEGYN
jgi:hypothetical protein